MKNNNKTNSLLQKLARAKLNREIELAESNNMTYTKAQGKLMNKEEIVTIDKVKTNIKYGVLSNNDNLSKIEKFMR